MDESVRKKVDEQFSNFSPTLRSQIKRWQTECQQLLDNTKVCDSHHSAVLGLAETHIQYSEHRNQFESQCIIAVSNWYDWILVVA